MCMRRDYQLHVIVTVLVLAAAVTNTHGQENVNAVVRRRVESDSGAYTHSPTQDTASEINHFTTASTIYVPNHRPVFRGFALHEQLLTKNFQGDQQFFTDHGDVAGHPTMPGSVSTLEAGDASTRLVQHEDTPAFSDIATTATAPLTSSAPTTPGLLVSMAQKDKPAEDKAREAEKVTVTTDSLTIPVVANTAPTVSGRRSNVPPSPNGSLHSQRAVVMETPVAPPVLTTSVRVEKGESEEPGVKNRTGPGIQLTKLTAASTGEVDEGTTTTTIITTTTITTMQTPGPCTVNFTDPEGHIEIPQLHSSASSPDPGADCTYVLTVYLGYGIEVQVLNVSLSEGEVVTVEDMGGRELSILANETVLMRGLVVRSWSNQISILYRSDQQPRSGSLLLLRYQAFLLSCAFPKEPANGEVSVTHLHAGGEAYFQCLTGYQLQGPTMLACRNATTPYWSGKEPKCLASCGGMIKNATLGRIISPGFPGNYSNNLTCHWVLEAPEGHRLHVHFEKVALAEDDDRLLIKNGNNIDSPLVYDSYEVEYLPNEGVVSTGRHLFVEFTTDGTVTSTGAAIRYEAFAKGTCYGPSSNTACGVGAVVEFACDLGYTLEQGSVIIECVDAENPQWNETEPACRAVCSGEITDSAGVVLSPNWPEAYDKGQDCIWGIHVEEDKRIMLDIQVLNVGKNDLLTFYDGDDLTANILGQYSGTRSRFKLYTSMADVTIQFQSDPATNIYGYGNGFVVHFFEVPRNDTCSELPEITNGWKSTSHPDLIHGTVVTYQCYPGYEVQGSEILMCQWDLTWSGDVPSCEKVMTCPDPGNVEHSRRMVTGSRFMVGSTVQYVCNKGYSLSGSTLLTCYNRDSANPKWSERLPKCNPEKYEPCRNPGAPSTSVQSLEKAFYQAGETLSFSCRTGYELQGEPTIRCVPGHPSQWSGIPPACRASSLQYLNERKLDVASPEYGMEGTNIAIAVLIPAAVVLVVILGIYLYFAKLQGKTIRMPTSSLPPYDNMTEESAFNNPIYDTGEKRDYEVTI
ncbi:seizure protein 6 homolog isoform 4-T4 [Salvelinus alpinus]